MMETNSLRPAFIISLDFELHWGVSERVRNPDHPYNMSLLGAREAVPCLLSLFNDRGIHATWATVGMLFARGRADLETFRPARKPAYQRTEVDTYRVPVGDSEDTDPLHFAAGLIDKIHSTPGQEIGSHTFCHYYCDEPGQGVDEFQADLEAARVIAYRNGIELRSLVFPRNQILGEYLPAVQSAGMACYRGNPSRAMHHLPTEGLKRYFVRGTRLADSYINITGHHTVPWSRIAAKDLANVQASHFFRPYSRRLRVLEPLRIQRVKAGLRAAAQRGEVYHLWWHPHNFGVNLEENLAALVSILDEFQQLQKRYGMLSLTMAEAAELSTAHFS